MDDSDCIEKKTSIKTKNLRANSQAFLSGLLRLLFVEGSNAPGWIIFLWVNTQEILSRVTLLPYPWTSTYSYWLDSYVSCSYFLAMMWYLYHIYPICQ